MEIQDYPHYRIYPDGRVWSKRRQGAKEGFKKLTPDRNGYLITTLTNSEGISKSHFVHRLVGIHYIPNPKNLPEVDHIDRNPRNAHISNLRWTDRITNCRNKNSCGPPNTSGHLLIYPQGHKRWTFRDTKTTPTTRRYGTKIDMICFKYIHNLRMRAGHYKRK